MNAEFNIQLSKDFPTLANAPIVEAALGIQARAESDWEARRISKTLRESLPDYPKVASHSQFVQAIKLGPAKMPETTLQDLGWNGIRIQSDSKPHVAQFNRDGFLFSRLKPYETWGSFITEAMRLWGIYLGMAKPTQVQRMNLRYVNRIDLPPKEANFEDYISPFPQTPRNLPLPFYGFFHQDMLAVPGHDYWVNIVRTIQNPQEPATQGIGLILDITVMTIQPFAFDPKEVAKRLPEMRGLKNEVFYGSVTEKALDLFK